MKIDNKISGIYKYWKGRKRSEETKNKISNTIKKNPIKHWSGKQRSEETRKKISKSLKGRFVGDKSPKWKGGYERKLYLNLRRRARKMNAEGSHTQEEWELLKSQYNWTCPACKRQESEIKLTEDHIIPLIKSGSDYIENIQPLCKSCNSRKHDKIINYKSSGGKNE